MGYQPGPLRGQAVEGKKLHEIRRIADDICGPRSRAEIQNRGVHFHAS
jgi:hypothetical protein